MHKGRRVFVSFETNTLENQISDACRDKNGCFKCEVTCSSSNVNESCKVVSYKLINL
jgi:hypothetical protein